MDETRRRRGHGLAMDETRRRGPGFATGGLYSPGGCGCALLMAPVMAASIGLAMLSLGIAALALAGLVAAVVLTVHEARRARSGAGARAGLVAVAVVLYLLCVPYLRCFVWFWFMD